METPIQAYFRVGTISSVSFPSHRYVEVIKTLAADDYFSFVEFGHPPYAEDAERIRQLIAQGYLEASYSAHGVVLEQGKNPNALAESRRKDAEAALLLALEEAYTMGAGRFTFLAGKAAPGTEEEALLQLEKTILAVCQRAKGRNMLVELELFDYDMDKCSLIGPAARAEKLAASVRTHAPNFGLMADLSHFPAMRENARDILRLLRPYLTHFHIGNIMLRPESPVYGDSHPWFGYPGSENDVPQLVGFLSELHREGFFDAEHPYPLTFEVKPQEGEDCSVILANSKRVLNRAWSLLEI